MRAIIAVLLLQIILAIIGASSELQASICNGSSMIPSSLSEEMRAGFISSLDEGDPYISDTAALLSRQFEGEYNINQVCTIYNALSRGWHYINRTDGDQLWSARETLLRGQASKSLGAGDCSDFAILISSLIESLGGSTRTSFAYDDLNQTGHVYSEVYLGASRDSRTNELIGWLQREYNISEIPGINNTSNGVWLNMDLSGSHPGSAYSGSGSTNVTRIILRESLEKMSPGIFTAINGPQRGLMARYANALEIARLEHYGPVYAVDLSMNGSRIATASGVTSHIWDVATGERISRMKHSGVVIDVKFSPEESKLATLSGMIDGSSAFIWNPALWADRGEELLRVDGRNITDLAFLPAERLSFVTVGLDGKTSVWDANTGEELLRMNLSSPIFALAVSADGRMIATACEDGAVIIWNATFGQKIAEMYHNYSVTTVAFSPDGTMIATGSYDNTSRIWDTASGAELSKMDHKAPVTVLAFSPDSSRLATGSAGIVRIWSVESGAMIVDLVHEDGINDIAFCPAGSKIATASQDGTVAIWEIETGRLLVRLEHHSPVNDLTFSRDGSFLATASQDGAARVWGLHWL